MSNSCNTCKKTEGKDTVLSRCSRCRTVTYCSAACQRADWKNHKAACARASKMAQLQDALSPDALAAVRPIGGRSRIQKLQDLAKWAESHNGDTLTIGAWQAMDLVNNLSRRLDNVLVVTVRRTASAEARTMYSLVDAQVVPMSVVSERFGGSPTETMSEMMARVDREQRAAGNIGAVLVMTFEQAAGDERPLREVMNTETTLIMQPLNLFDIHRRKMFEMAMTMATVPQSKIPDGASGVWKVCVKNSLDGGAYSWRFVKWAPK